MRIRNAVAPIVGVNIFIFILQASLGNWFTNSIALVSADLLSRPWILVTSMFAHGNIMHLFFNMYVLMMFGPILEQRIGAANFIKAYFFFGIAAGLVAAFFYPSALGASGAIMGVLGVIIVLMPYLQVLFFFIVPMPLWAAAIIIALMDILGVFHPSGTANIAHLAGLGSGLLYGYILKKRKKGFNRRFERKTHLSPEDIQDYLRSGRI